MWIHHASGCGKAFQWDHIIKPGEECPKCRKPFAEPIVEYTCKGCNTIYYADVLHPIGSEFRCPINNEWIKVESIDRERIQVVIPDKPSPSPSPPPQPLPPCCWQVLLGVIGFIRRIMPCYITQKELQNTLTDPKLSRKNVRNVTVI